MPTGTILKKLEDEKGIIIRFVIGRSPNPGDNLDIDINNENKKTNDFLILNDHVEAPEERPKKTKLFFVDALEHWDAEFYVKVNDDIYLNIGLINGMNQNGGNLGIKNHISDMLLGKYLRYLEHWPSLSQ